VTRSILAIVAVVLSGVAFTTSAEACISCDYVPEVVRQPSPRFYAPPYSTRSYRTYPGYSVRAERSGRARRHVGHRQRRAIR